MRLLCLKKIQIFKAHMYSIEKNKGFYFENLTHTYDLLLKTVRLQECRELTLLTLSYLRCFPMALGL